MIIYRTEEGCSQEEESVQVCLLNPAVSNILDIEIQEKFDESMAKPIFDTNAKLDDSYDSLSDTGGSTPTEL